MRLAFVGDIALFRNFDLRRNNLGAYFSDVKSILDGCLYRIGKLETPLVTNESASGNKSAYISSLSEM